MASELNPLGLLGIEFTEFASPETLVAFALGLTLFVITLGLNVVALYIVRKYREQYE